MPEPTKPSAIVPAPFIGEWAAQGGTGQNLGITPGEFKFQVKPDANNALIRAQGQGFGEQLGLTLANGVSNFVTGMGEMVGYGGALISEWGKDNKDYSNWLTKAMQDAHNPFGEVYRTDPNALVDMGDSAWWLNTFGDLAVSAATFAIPGAGLASMFGKAAKVAALAVDGERAARLGLTTKNLLSAGRTAANIATSATLAYAEGAMSGYKVYEKTFDTQYNKLIKDGKSMDEATQTAKELASNAAATTVQLNTILNTGLNVIQLMPFFHDAEEATKGFVRANKMKAGENAGQYAERMRGLVQNGGAKKFLAESYRPSVLGQLGTEALSEGTEELTNQFAERTGYAQGEKGAKVGMIEQLGELSNYFDRTMDAEGALSFALGAIGGMAQGVLIDRLPVHLVDKIGADGKAVPKMTSGDNPQFIYDPKTGKQKFEKTLVTGITRKYNGQVEHFNSIAESLANDANWFDNKHRELQQATEANDYAKANQIRHEMMDVTNLNAVRSGMADNVRAMYEQLGQVDNTKDVGTEMLAEIEKKRQEVASIEDPNEQAAAMAQLDSQQAQAEKLVGKTQAMINGLSYSTKDNRYKKQATRALERVDAIQTSFDEAEREYGYDDSDKRTGVQDFMFSTMANQRLTALNIKHNTEDLEEARIEFNKSNPINTNRNALDVANEEFSKQATLLKKVHEGLISDSFNIGVLARKIHSGQATDTDKEHFRSLMQKHGVSVSGSISGDANAVQKAIKAEADQIEQQHKTLEETLEQSAGYTEWQASNPTKTIEEYHQKLQETFGYNDHIDSLTKAIEEGKSALNIKNAQVARLKTSGLKNLRMQAKADFEKAQREANERNNAALANAEGNTLVARAAAATRANQLKLSLKELDRQIAEKQGELTELAREHAKLRQIDWTKAQAIKDRFLDGTQARIRTLAVKIATLNAEILRLKEERDALATAPVEETEVPPVDTEPVVESTEPEQSQTPPTQPAPTAPTATAQSAPVVTPTPIQLTKSEIESKRQEALDNIHATQRNNKTVFVPYKHDANGKNTLVDLWGIEGNTKEEVVDKINAKYDADLAALEPAPVQTTPAADSTMPVYQANTRSYVTQKVLDYVAEVLEVPKYTDDINSGTYVSWLMNQGPLGQEVATLLNSPLRAMEAIYKYGESIKNLKTVVPVTPDPAPAAPVDVDAMVNKWYEEVTQDGFYLTTPELEAILKGYVGDAMTPEQIAATVQANLKNIHHLTKFPTDYATDLYSHIYNNFPATQHPGLFNLVETILRELEDPRMPIPSDAEMVQRYMDELPNLDKQNVVFLANFTRALADSMQKEVMSFDTLMQNQHLIQIIADSNDKYDPAEFITEEEAAPEPEMPTDGDSSQPREGVTQESATDFQKSIHAGKKSLDANSVATATLDYTEDSTTDGTVRKLFFSNKRDADGNLVMMPGVNTDILFPEYIKPGDELILTVEIEPGMLDAKGNIPLTGNEIGQFKIVISGPDGRKIGNVHTTEWTEASRILDASGDEEFRNIGGDASKVKAAQTELLDFRHYIATTWNNSKGAIVFKTNVLSKGPGTVNLHMIQKNPGEPKKLVPWISSKALPDTSIQLGVILNGMVKTKWDVQDTASSIGIADANSMHGYPVAILPMADGSKSFALLERTRLAADENSPVYQTALRVLEIYLNKIDGKEVADILAATGHNILTATGLKAFMMEQITETSPVVGMESVGDGTGRYLIQVDANGVVVGKHGGGRNPERVSMGNQLTEDFKGKLLELFKQRFSVVSIENAKFGTRGLNSAGKFTKVTYNPATGKWVNKEFPSYNEYIKSLTTTRVDGTAKTADGRYTYASNPRIDFDRLGIQAVKPISQPTVTSASSQAEDAAALDILMGFDNLPADMTSVPVHKPVTPDPSVNSKPMNRYTLEELFNSLPANKRNNSTVDDVLRERVSLGHTFIADGDNPFRRCS